MHILVVGATGATGRRVVNLLLDRGHHVRAIVRNPDSLPEDLRHRDGLSFTTASLLGLSDAEMQEHVRGCDAVVSCLGHNISFKGIYGKPRRLVTDATRRLCESIRNVSPGAKTKFILMNTVGNANRDLKEHVSFAQRLMIGLLRLLLPPHVDNEQAADYLRTEVGQDDPDIEWVAVRPDTLIEEEEVSQYEIHPSPTTSLFKPRKTSRINVAHFMTELIVDDALWNQWKGQMPVIYNLEQRGEQ